MATRTAIVVSIVCLIAETAVCGICSSIPTVENAFDRSSIVLVGKVIQQDRFSGASKVRVERVFKGSVPAVLDVLAGDSADLRLSAGKRYLIFTSLFGSSGHTIRVDLCSGSMDANEAKAQGKMAAIEKIIDDKRRVSRAGGH